MVLLVLGWSSGAVAASYLRLDGVVVDPILTTGGTVHSYMGPNLAPGVVLRDVDLSSADLSFANLTHTNIWACCGDGYQPDLSGANFRNSDFSYSFGKGGLYLAGGADFTNAKIMNADIGAGTGSNFTNVDFTGSEMSGDFTNAIFVAADLSGTWDLEYGVFTGATYSGGSLSNRTLFPTGFDPIAAGMVLVPEPSTAILVTLGLIGISLRRKATKTS